MAMEQRPDTPKFNFPPTVVNTRPNTPKVLRSKQLARHASPRRVCRCHSRSDTVCATTKIV
jgi:hypothetical protein